MSEDYLPADYPTGSVRRERRWWGCRFCGGRFEFVGTVQEEREMALTHEATCPRRSTLSIDATQVSATALDGHAVHVVDRMFAIRDDPTGPTARRVRDDLRRAHPNGVDRNYAQVQLLIRMLPREMWTSLLSPRCRCADTYRKMLAP